MSDDIGSEQETPSPAVPNGASPSMDPNLAKSVAEGGGNANGSDYLDDKGQVMNTEGLLNRFKELSEVDNPGMSVLVVELQELRAYSHRIGVIATAALPMLTACALCAVILTSRILAKDGE